MTNRQFNYDLNKIFETPTLFRMKFVIKDGNRHTNITTNLNF